MSGLRQDLRFAWRGLRKSPGFTALAVATLALGIGASTAIFSVADAVLLRPLPYPDPDRLVAVQGSSSRQGDDEAPVSFADFRDLRSQARSFEHLAAASPLWSFVLTGAGEAEQVPGLYVSANLLDLLGVRPALGRAFTSAEDRPGGPPVVILGHGLWRRRFGGDPGVLGKTLTVSGAPATIVGVLPAGFHFLEADADLWVPLEQNQFAASARAVRLLSLVGRLRPGLAPEQAAAELGAIATRLAAQHPDSNAGRSLRAISLHEQATAEVRPALLLLLGAVAMLLLIACANVANLLLVRASARARELAVRAALGAGRARLARQLLAESLLLALLGGALGALLAGLAVELLLLRSPVELPRYHPVAVDARAWLFAFGAALLTGLLFGLLPLRRLRALPLAGALKHGTPGALGDRGQRRWSGLLVVGELALAVVLVAGGGLLLRSFQRLLAVDPGLATENVLTLQLGLPPGGYQQPERRVAFYRQLEQSLAALPGVRAVGFVTRLPFLAAMNNITSTLVIEGHPVPPGQRPEIDFRRASSGYFAALGIPLLGGRPLTPQDAASGGAVLINEAAARRFWPGPGASERALGKRVSTATNTGDRTAWQTVVGVVGNVRHLGLPIAPRPEIYYHQDSSPPFGPVLVVRASSDPRGLLPAVREKVRALDAAVPLSRIHTMQELVSASLAQRRFALWLVNLFAGAALLLAGIGIYGLTAFSVGRRTREIGVRTALGATPSRVVGMILGQGLRLALAGVALGLAGAFASTHLLQALLYEVSATDPLTFAAIPLLSAAVALLASWLPARRAARVAPLVALRSE